MFCATCGTRVPTESRACPGCGEDGGFPNVRMASLPEEVDALQKRLQSAEVSAKAAGYSGVLEAFGAAVLTSKVVIARPLAIIMDLLQSEFKTYTTFQHEVYSQARISQPNQFDRTRLQFENALFPNFSQEIRFGALTLEDRWLRGYGEYAIILREKMIARRSTVFEENPVVFTSRHHITLDQTIPPGYRATWYERHNLAKAKLYAKLNFRTSANQFPGVLIGDGSGTGNVDYVEVHIYGTFNRNAIEKVLGPRPKSREDKLLWRKLTKSAEAVGATVVEL